jgi:TfoX/Sxy family transcriptional regulator of competence genes
MAWEKSPPWLVELFAASLPDRPGLTRRKMFGFPAAFANGNMFAGLFEETAIARLPPGVRAELDAEYGERHFEPMPGRPMRAYAVIPEDILEDEARFAALLDAAYGFVAAMPPKQKAPAKPRRAKTAGR